MSIHETARSLHDYVAAEIKRGTRTIRLVPGEYHVGRELLPDRYCFISNNDAGWKRILFQLDGVEDVVLDGQGARIICHGEVLPLYLRDCRNVTVRNLTIDWERPAFTQIEVVAAKGDTIEFTTDQERYPLVVDGGRLVAVDDEGWRLDHLWNLLTIDRARREVLPGIGEHWHLERFHEATDLGEGRYRLRAHWQTLPPAGQLAILMHGDRTAPAVVIDTCEETLLEDVTLHHALGMGVVAQMSRDTTLRRVRVEPGGDRVFSTWVDATHFVDCDGAIRLLDCHFSGQCDDASNIHGAYREVQLTKDATRVLLQVRHPQQAGINYLLPGDTVAFDDGDTLQTVARGQVAAVTTINTTLQAITLAEPLELPADRRLCARRDAPRPEVEVRGCYIGALRGRGLLLSVPGRITVAENTFHVSGNAIAIHGDATYWYESGPVDDVTIRHNTFDACNAAVVGHVLIVITPDTAPQHRLTPYHHNIRITDNSIRRVRPELLHAHSVANLTFTNNTINWHPDYDRQPGGPAIDLGLQVVDAEVQQVEED